MSIIQLMGQDRLRLTELYYVNSLMEMCAQNLDQVMIAKCRDMVLKNSNEDIEDTMSWSECDIDSQLNDWLLRKKLCQREKTIIKFICKDVPNMLTYIFWRNRIWNAFYQTYSVYVKENLLYLKRKIFVTNRILKLVRLLYSPRPSTDLRSVTCAGLSKRILIGRLDAATANGEYKQNDALCLCALVRAKTFLTESRWKTFQ